MKIYAIRDDYVDPKKNLAFLFYDEKTKRYHIELVEGIDEWQMPLLLSSYVKRGKYTVTEEHSEMWVMQRVSPQNRLMSGELLRNNLVPENDPIKLLVMCDGRCCQDECFIVKVSEEEALKDLPGRFDERISETVMLGDKKMLVFFEDGECRLLDAGDDLFAKSSMKRLLKYYERLKECRICSGGSELVLTPKERISAEEVRREGVRVPVTAKELRMFAAMNLLTTGEVCELTGCSRQNVDDLVKRGKVTPIKASPKNMLFWKNDFVK